MSGRQVFFGSTSAQHNTEKYLSNRITTARYNLLTFLPIQLFEQFKKAANVYFLFIGFLQQIPNLSPTGQYTTIGPLAVFVALSMVREAYDDIKRHRQDRRENERETEVLHEGEWKPKRWKNIKVGDVCRVKKNEGVPADILLMSSSHPSGSCYVETSSLDGETSLKERSALRISQENLRLVEEYQGLQGYVRAEKANANLYVFDGYLSTEDETVPLTINQLLLRGSSVKNTTYAVGLVLYTGEESKIRLNATKPPTKFPTIERITNLFIFILFTFVVGISVICTTFSVFWEKEIQGENYWYLTASTLNSQITTFFAFLILFNTLIPISLYVTLEFVKLIQAAYIGWDREMYDKESDTFAQSRTSSLNEELGQVHYVFTDKTGTLTENKMVFRWCTTGGMAYQHKKLTDVEDSAQKFSTDDLHVGMTASSLRIDSEKKDIVFGPTSSTTIELIEKLRNTPQDSVSFQFMLAMALCHTVVPVEEGGKLDYQGPSPDEVSLVIGASQLEFKLIDRSAEHIVVRAFGEALRYDILNVLEFTSNRKRMSVILRCPDGKIRLYCKGADSVLYKLLDDHNADVDTTKEHVDHFAEGGLRILVYAFTEIPDDRFDQWRRIYQDASVSLERRQEQLSAAADLIEQQLHLLGATAIEDRLQQGVPDSIQSLTQAGIKVWMLTGDKLETAINVGYACSLIQRESQLVVLAHDDDVEESKVGHKLQRGFRAIEQSVGIHTVMVIDGQTLSKILSEPELVPQFLSISSLVNSVICCRVSPMQKADVVTAVKNGMNKITLAIGDGANDVSMIQASHVGIGITGREGTQAARASDYSIAQFRFLKRLLLVHGHWNYVRVAKFFLGSFYKCMAFYLTQAAFQPFNGFSSTSLYEQWTLAAYNLFFSSVPVILIGMFEKDLRDTTLMSFPQLYQVGGKNELFTFGVFIRWMLQGVYHAAAVSLVPFLLYGYFEGSSFNNDDGMILLGTMIYTAVIIVVTFKIGFMESHNWTWANHIANWGSIAFWFLYQAVYSGLLSIGIENYGVFLALWRNSKFLLVVFLTVVVALVPDLVWKYHHFNYNPTLSQSFQHLEKYQNGRWLRSSSESSSNMILMEEKDKSETN